MGVREAVGWIEDRGETVLGAEDLRWALAARDRMGCKLRQDGLTHTDRVRLIMLGRRCAEGAKGG
jgi:hypothetical protein